MALRKDPIAREMAPVSALGVISPPPIEVKSNAFNGSLGMLFQCVRDHKVNLIDVPLFPVCESYFRYLIAEANTNLDEASVALVALAYLLERKAWMLLPTSEPEPETLEDSTSLFEGNLSEYESAIEVLHIFQEERSKRFFRSEEHPFQIELPLELENARPELLAGALARLLERAVPIEFINPSRERRSLSDVVQLMLSRLTSRPLPMTDLFEEPYTREDAVYGFLALLELVRNGLATLKFTEADVYFSKA